MGTSSFCPSGGCLGLFLNRYDLFNVFKPDLGGSWVEYGESTLPPTTSPAPTWPGGCDEPHNFHLDRCFRKRNRPRASAVVWDSLGAVGQFTLFLLAFMSVTLAVSIFLARARKRRRKGESYMAFLLRDARRKSKKKKKRRKVRGNKDLKGRAWMCAHAQATAVRAVPSLVLRADLGVSRAVRETVLAPGARRRMATLNPGSNWFELIIIRCIIVGRLPRLHCQAAKD